MQPKRKTPLKKKTIQHHSANTKIIARTLQTTFENNTNKDITPLTRQNQEETDKRIEKRTKYHKIVKKRKTKK
jgi:hypothetical protein